MWEINLTLIFPSAAKSHERECISKFIGTRVFFLSFGNNIATPVEAWKALIQTSILTRNHETHEQFKRCNYLLSDSGTKVFQDFRVTHLVVKWKSQILGTKDNFKNNVEFSKLLDHCFSLNMTVVLEKGTPNHSF